MNPYLKLAVGGLIVFTSFALIAKISNNDRIKRLIYDRSEYCYQYPDQSDCKTK